MIYLVDDQKAFLKILKTNYGDKIKTFDHPNDAFLQMLTDKPSILITDVFMPQTPASENMMPRGMDGLKLVEIVKSSLPDTAIIVISGNERSEIEKKFPGKLANIKYFFNKPLEEDFYDLIDKLESKSNKQK